MVKGRLGKKSKGKPGKPAKKNIKKKSFAKKKALGINDARRPAPASSPTPTPATAPVAEGGRDAHQASKREKKERVAADGGKDANRESKKEKKERVDVERTSGFIFMCNGKTKPECYRHRVFGLPTGKLEVVEKITEGAKLFLFDTDMKLLYGIYKAVGNGGKDLEPRAFNGRFPSQVRFKIFKDCLPLHESVFKHAIEENYETKFKFKPELNSKQVRKLFTLFRPLPEAPLSSAVDDRHPVQARRSPPKDLYVAAPHVKHAPLRPRAHVPLVTHSGSDPYGYPARAPPVVESRHLPAFAAPPPSDPYRYPARPPPIVEYRHLPAVAAPPPSDPYGYAARAPPVVESRHLPSVAPPPSDPYYLLDAQRPYLPENPVVPEHELYRRYRSVTEMIPRERLEVASLRDHRMLARRESEVLPRSDRLDEYYALRTARQAVDLPPQTSYLRPGYEDPNRIYADSYSRPVSGNANASNVPVSSLYSFAGAPSYRAP
ncbi:hypothetical protein AAC387_Pa02g3770 [Persea americana]